MFFIFFFNDTATTEIYTLSLHDALPISTGGGFRPALSSSTRRKPAGSTSCRSHVPGWLGVGLAGLRWSRSEEHTSELQSQSNLVCRLLLEKKKKQPSAY